MNLVPPKVYHPRCVVIVQALFDDQAGGFAPATWTAIPRSVEVERNSARKADTCRIELDYRDFPLDPRLLKDMLVTAHIEAAVDPAAPIVPTPLNKRFVGLVDSPETTLGPTNETVRLEARDYTGIYLDFRWEEPIPVYPGTLQTVVEYIRARVTPLTVPAVFTDPSAATADVGSRLGKTLFTPDKDDTAWDVLQKVCDLFGLVPVWDLDVLTIRSPSEPGVGSAFMVYGQNVERLQFSRNLKQPAAKQVKIVAWNPITGVPSFAVYPPTASVIRLDEKGKPKPTVKQVQYNVEGQYDPATLALLAQRVHTELSQEQLMGELETRDMTDLFEGSVVGLANGDQLICKLSPEIKASIEGMSPAEAVAFLSNPARPNSLNPAAAQALVTAWTAAQALAITFYVTDTVHRWHRDDGYRLTVKFRDFVLGV